MAVRVLQGDAREVLAELDAGSVQTCICSPPFFGLRKYLPAGHPDEHREIGSEPTVGEYVAALVAVFEQVKRVLRDDGTLHIEIGDSYSGGGPHHGERNLGKSGTNRGSFSGIDRTGMVVPAKNLLGIPWRVAFALQDAGWILRSEIIWARPNPMPESVQDRVTRSHSTVFMFAKQARYFFDPIAIAEKVSGAGPRVPRVVERANLGHQRIVLSDNVRPENIAVKGSVSPASTAYAHRLFEVAVRVASAILDSAQCQEQFGLAPLDAKVRQEEVSHLDRVLISRSPEIHRAALLATSFLNADMSPKGFLEEVNRLAVALPDTDVFRIVRSIALVADAPSVNRDGDASVRVDDTSEIGKSERVNNGRHNKVPPNQDYTLSAGVSQSSTRNRRSVWTIPSSPYAGAHFACWPPALVEPMVLCSTSARGACGQCGSPWRRVIERTAETPASFRGSTFTKGKTGTNGMGRVSHLPRVGRQDGGWEPTCRCGCAETRPCVVLDPFAGSGTTLAVAQSLGRDAVGIDLNADYGALIDDRVAQAQPPLFGIGS